VFTPLLSGDEGLKALEEVRRCRCRHLGHALPGMDGALFLHHVLTFYPDANPFLLTESPGGMQRSVRKQRRIFRFLTKPCPPDQLKAAVEEESFSIG